MYLTVNLSKLEVMLSINVYIQLNSSYKNARRYHNLKQERAGKRDKTLHSILTISLSLVEKMHVIAVLESYDIYVASGHPNNDISL